ncbi:MAG: CPBP family intramembrane metalloprotease [Dysgonamonadaceae bacterium]|jgi:hypothetical protein|nr:CPBP family intramembrane metalloprotease [Dysgonamonadaceae bacterium]
MWAKLTKLQKFFFVLILLELIVAIVGKYLCEKYSNISKLEIKRLVILQIIGAVYMLVPAISVLIVEKWNFRKIFRDYNIRLKAINIYKSAKYILLTAFLLPVLIMFFSYLFGNVFGIKEFGFLIISKEDLYPLALTNLPAFFHEFTSRMLIGIPLLTVVSLFTGCTFNLFFALGEEIAWRGFLEKEMTVSKKLKPLLIGIIWGLWHTPLILLGLNFKDHYIGGIFVMVIVCIALAYYFSRSLHQSRTLLVPAAMHGIINAFSVTIASDIFVKTGNPLLGPPLGLTFALSVVTILFLLRLFRKRTINEET